MSTPKLQHYVPKFILRQFANSKEQLYVFDKSNEKIFPNSIKTAGGETNYYNFEIEDEKLTLEHDLSKIEDIIAPYIKRIIEERSVAILKDKERIELSVFLSIQMVRIPSFSAMANDLRQQIKNIAIKQGAPENYFEIYSATDKVGNVESIFRASQIMTAHEQAKYFVNKDWFLMETDAEHPFIIGDNPLCLHNDISFGAYGNLGLAVPWIQIYFPLTPTLALAIYCPSHYNKFLSFSKNISYICKKDLRMLGIYGNLYKKSNNIVDAIKTGGVLNQKSENVIFFNSLQISSAERFVFSSSKDFSLAQKMIQRNPKLKKGNRAKF
jgi:hypothetical protein